MAEAAAKLPVKTEGGEAEVTRGEWPSSERLRQEIDRLLDNFHMGSGRVPFRRPLLEVEPFWRRESESATAPAGDIVEKDNACDASAELPRINENISVSHSEGTPTIKGEQEEAEEESRREDYRPSEGHHGSFQRSSTPTRSRRALAFSR